MTGPDNYELFVKTLPALNTIGLTGLIGMWLRHRIQYRKVTADAEAAAHKLAIEEEIADRQGWGELIKTLTEQVERQTAQVDKLDSRVRALQDENGLLRSEIRELHGVIDGMRRETQAEKIHGQRAVVEALAEGGLPPATLAAVKRSRR